MRRPARPSVAFAAHGLALAAALLPGPLLAGPRPLTPEDLLALTATRDPQISPDGALVAYTVTTIDVDDDKSETAVWAVPVDGGKAWRMTAPGASATQPRWSPDGRRLAFLSSRSTDDDDAETQVWAFDLRGGDAQPLTDVKQGVADFAWSPDGGRLLLAIQDPKPEDLMDKAEKAKHKPEPHVIDRLQFKRDYTGYLDRRRTHLYVFDLADEALTQITSGDFDDDVGAWSPDGKLVAFASNRTEEPDANVNSDLWIVSAANTDQGATLRRVTANPGPDHSPAWSPDGAWLTYVTGRSPELMWYALERLAVTAAGGPAAGSQGDERLVTPELDRNVSTPHFTPDGKALLFELEDRGAAVLGRVQVGGGTIARPVDGEIGLRSYSQSGDGRIAYLAGGPMAPPEVFVAAGSGAPRQLTHGNEKLLADVALGRVEKVHFPSADGTEIEAFVTFPPDFDARLTYPTILWNHGGPTSQYDWSFHSEAQYFAGHGYIVIRANPRGSTGYGEDFCRAIFADWGHLDFEDVMAAVDFALARGWTDPQRLGVGGWSYGGILTNYVITQSDRFAGAISGASEVLYAANYGHDHYQYEWEAELGLPWEHRDLWERLSPFNRIENIVTPTLVMGGAEDWNVPVQNSEQLYQGLKRLGRTTQLVVYPGEHHGIGKPSFRLDRWQRYLAWFDRYVKGEAPAADPAAAS
jgi:dipeptidyl aminopeptidase/acylaminoacyl peptidase